MANLAHEGTFPTKIADYAYFDGLMYDITKPSEKVEVKVSHGGTVLWVNVGMACVLRICRADISVDEDY